MKLGATTLPGCTIIGISHSSKQTVHVYDWSDECAVTDMGHGPSQITCQGTLTGTTDRFAVDAAVEAARTTETHLNFPSVNGASDDYYFRVYTSPCKWTPITGTVYQYEFTAIAVVPWVYEEAGDTRVT